MRLFLLALILPFLVACKTSPYGDVPKELASKVRTFEDVVRWGALEKMYLFLDKEEQQGVKVPEGLSNVRVTSYEVASPITKLEEGRWSQTAVIDYVLVDRQIVRKVIDQQVWVSDDEDGKIWYRGNPVPQFQ